MNTPNFAGDNGAQAGRLLGTAVFIKDDVVVRVIHYEGDFSAIGKHMAQQKGVHLIEDALKPYLVERESATSEADFRAHFKNAKAADAEIVHEPSDQSYGRSYWARDLEGHDWFFTTPPN